MVASQRILRHYSQRMTKQQHDVFQSTASPSHLLTSSIAKSDSALAYIYICVFVFLFCLITERKPRGRNMMICNLMARGAGKCRYLAFGPEGFNAPEIFSRLKPEIQLSVVHGLAT